MKTKQNFFYPFIFLLVIIFLLINVVKFEYNKELQSSVDAKNCNEINFQKYDSRVQNLKKLEFNIIIHNNRGWTVNKLRSYTEVRKANWILPKYKKRFDATINIKDSLTLNCNIHAKIRLHGDLFDHLDPLNNSSSLDVKLKNGHIQNNVAFKLFRPVSRNFENEIFITSILREIGFLAPRTSFVKVKLEDQEFDYIYQERINKEFLENLNRREGPILEGDERFEWCLNLGEQYVNKKHRDFKRAVQCQNFADKRQLVRLVNNNWSQKGYASTYISTKAVSELNKVYLLYSKYYKGIEKKYNYLPLHQTLPSEDVFSSALRLGINSFSNNDLIQTFDSLLYAMGAAHGLHKNDRVFYYDSIYGKVEPIYYDGMAQITGLENKGNKKRIEYGVSLGNGPEKAIEKIKKININDFLYKLELSGLKLSENKLKYILRGIIERLESLKQKETDLIALDFDENLIFENLDDKYKKLVFFDKNQIKNLVSKNEEKHNNGKVKICDLDLDYCATENFTLKEIAKALAQRYTDKNNKDFLFIDEDVSKYKENQSLKKYLSSQKKNKRGIDKWEKNIFNDSLKFITNSHIQAKIDANEKKITFKQTNNEGRAVVIGKKIEGWKIIFDGINQNPDNLKKTNELQRFNNVGLTGCLTFIDSNINNAKIVSNNSNCEDAINFIRTNGIIENIEVNRNRYDGIDADFSNLIFKEILVNKSGNDCLDFSFGKYNIENATLTYCQDKAISVGEKSQAKFNNLNISNSNTAITSKDSSYTEVDELNVAHVKNCLSAYRKKQEFSGAIIKYNKNELYGCTYEISTDIASKIFF